MVDVNTYLEHTEGVSLPTYEISLNSGTSQYVSPKYVNIVSTEHWETIREERYGDGPYDGFTEYSVTVSVQGWMPSSHSTPHKPNQMVDQTEAYFDADPDSDPVYLVSETYSTGDTFSHTEGRKKYHGVFRTREEAEAHFPHVRLQDGYFEHSSGCEVEEIHRI